MATEEVKFQPKDYKSDQYVRWCPGCGDHAVLNCLHKAMAEVGVAPHNMAVISGIGCSSRLPYYMNTYGFHTWSKAGIDHNFTFGRTIEEDSEVEFLPTNVQP